MVFQKELIVSELNERERYEVRKRHYLARLTEYAFRSNSPLSLMVSEGLGYEIEGRKVYWRGLDYVEQNSEALFIVDPPQWVSDTMDVRRAA